MNIKRFEFNLFGENTYIVWDSASKEASIVDPGMMALEEISMIDAFIAGENLKPMFILLTHVHLDHTFGVDHLVEKYNLEILAHKADALLGQTRAQQARMFHLPVELSPIAIDRFINDNSQLKLGSEPIEVIHTPGHTLGGLCFYFPDSRFILTGDTLFLGSIGRTDLPGGNYSQLIDSIKTRLLNLPPDTVVYPGHGPSTTIAQENKSNPYL